LQSPTAILRFVQERVVDQIVEYVGFVAVIVVVLAIVIGFIWWCAAPLDLLPLCRPTRRDECMSCVHRFVAKRLKMRQKTELTDPIAQW